MSDNEEKLIESLEEELIEKFEEGIVEKRPTKNKYQKYDNFISFVFGIIIFIVTILTFIVNWKIGLTFLGSTIIIGIIYYYVRKFINK